MGRHTVAKASTREGELSLTKTDTDSPILPAAQLRELQAIDPKLVEWVIQQTEVEANFRRRECAASTSSFSSSASLTSCAGWR